MWGMRGVQPDRPGTAPDPRDRAAAPWQRPVDGSRCAAACLGHQQAVPAGERPVPDHYRRPGGHARPVRCPLAAAGGTDPARPRRPQARLVDRLQRRLHPAISADDAERRVAAAPPGQAPLSSRDPPPQIHVILDEAVLHRQVGGPAVTRQQLTALAETATWPNVVLQVIPFTAGANAGMDGHFVILAFPEPEDPQVAYVEGLMGDVYVEAGEEVDRFTLAWTHLVTQALDPAESAAMIRTLAKEQQ